ncbi:MAG: MBL fold metallo-hydrolase [Anaerolineales bacterium]|nr:MBL fold metallo-hydrolase [Anaerolineales bacterium]
MMALSKQTGNQTVQLRFLGTGAGCGVPSFYCDCVACQEARQEPRYCRTRCALLIQGEKNTLIDAPPDLRQQLLHAGINQIDHFILTHSHYDHTGGLGELEFYVRVSHPEAIPTYMTATTQDWLHTSFGFLEDCLYVQPLDVGWSFVLDDVNFTALDVTHAPGTLGFLMETAGRRTAYIPDTGPLPISTLEKLDNIDTLILGATFWGKNWMPDDHLSVDEAVQIGLNLQVKQLYLTHLSMHHDTPVTNQALEAYLHRFGKHINLAYDGLAITL